MKQIQKKYQIRVRKFGLINWIGAYNLYVKEVSRFLIVWAQTLLSPLISSLLFLSVLSLAIGNERGNVLGFSFISFLAPGLIAMSIIQQSFSHSSSSLMIGKIQGNIIDTLLAPLSATEVTLAIILAAVTRSIIITIISMIVFSFIIEIYIYSFFYIFIFFVLIAMQSYSQNKIEDDTTIDKNQVEIAVNNAEKQILNGNFHNALKTLKQALLNLESIGDMKGQGKILSKIANLQYSIDEYKNAEYSIKKAIDIQTNIDDILNLAISRNTYGLIYLSQNDYLNALDYFKSARTIFEEEHLNKLIAEVTLSEAKAYIGLDNLTEAKIGRASCRERV